MNREKAKAIVASHAQEDGCGPDIEIAVFYGVVGDAMALCGAVIHAYIESRSLGQPIDAALLLIGLLLFASGFFLVALATSCIWYCGRLRTAYNVLDYR